MTEEQTDPTHEEIAAQIEFDNLILEELKVRIHLQEVQTTMCENISYAALQLSSCVPYFNAFLHAATTAIQKELEGR